MSVPVNPKYPLFLREVNKGNTTVGGYPVVTLEDNFNIQAKHNTFYNIKNNADDEININFKDEEFYTTGKNKCIMFTWDNFNPESTISFLLYIGGVVVEDNSVEGYKYRMDIDESVISADSVKLYLSNNIIEGADVTIYCNFLGQESTEEIKNIHIINKDIDYRYYISVLQGDMTTVAPHIILEEVENDSEFKHKYKYYGLYNMTFSSEYLYTNESYDKATSIFIYNGESYIEATITNKVLNKDIKPSNIANEFIFNFNSPANIIFNQKIKWNNNETPDLTKTGIYTISIVNGVGCYTFVNS